MSLPQGRGPRYRRHAGGISLDISGAPIPVTGFAMLTAIFSLVGLAIAALLDEDSTFYGDLFAHVVEWKGDMYLEDGLHRALRAALQQRLVLHARVLVVD